MGQVLPESAFGNAIRFVVSQDKYRTFCEVGTWNGQGTTVCLYTRRPGTHLYSIEGNPAMYASATRYWQGKPGITLLYGTLHRSILSREDVERHPRFPTIKEHYWLHYAAEELVAQNAPLVTVLPCDVVLLDGGEFSTQGDWETLRHPGIKVVILDDTQVMKTYAIYDELKSSLEWICLRDEPHDRNGWAIFERVTESVGQTPVNLLCPGP